MNRPSWLLDIPADEYHQATKDNTFLSSHRLAIFRKCPLEYKKRIDGEIVEKDTDSFVLGRATHTFILEGEEKFANEYIVSDGPINDKTGKPYGRTTERFKAWSAEQNKPVISSDDFAVIKAMSEAVHSHKAASGLLSEGIAEGTVRATWDGVQVQARMDWFDNTRNCIADLKTCADLDRFRFDIRDFGYVEQLAFYANVVRLAREDAGTKLMPPDCWLIAVEKKEPYRVAVIYITRPTIGDANEMRYANETFRDDNDAMIDQLKRCRERNEWPTRYESVINI